MDDLRLILRFTIPKLKNIIYFPLYLIRGNKISFQSVISKHTHINNSIINKYTYIGPYCILNSVHIGNYTSIAPNVMLGGAEHSYWWYSTSHFLSKKNIGGKITRIGNDVWIGTHSTIRQGITIGNGAVIGAGSVVLNDVAPYSIVVGVPAKPIKNRFDDEIIAKITKTKFWNFDPKEARILLNKLDK